MESKVIDLNKVYKEDRMFYWCNCTGDINVPGDGSSLGGNHTPDDLPPKAKELFEDYWSELNGCHEYVVSLDGKVGYAFGFILDRMWYRATLNLEQSQLQEIALEQAEKMFSDPGLENLKLLYGVDTDPEGDELLVFLPYENRGYIRCIAEGTNIHFSDSDSADGGSAVPGKYNLYDAVEAYLKTLTEEPEESKVEEKTETPTAKYVVCFDSSYIRDAQMFDTNGVSDEDFYAMDSSSVENEEYWHDMEPTAFVSIETASSGEEACAKAADHHGYDKRCLYAIEV